MSTGVKVDDAVVNQFNDFKLKKLGVKYIIYKIDKVNGADKIITDTTGDSSATFDSFQASLPSNDARYAVIDHDYTTKDGRPGNKIVFIAW